MKNGQNKLIKYCLNIATSGKYFRHREFATSDYLIRYVLMNIFTILGFILLVIYTIYNLHRQMYTVAFACAIMGLIGLSTFFLARTKVKPFIPSFIIMSFYCLFCGWITWIHQSQGVNFLFIYVYPLVAIMLLGMRCGVTLSLVLLAIVSAEMFIPGFSNYEYHIKVSTRMLAAYVLVLSAMIVIEITRRAKDALIKKQRQELENFNTNLQSLVEERTQNVLSLQTILFKTMAEMMEYRDHITGGHIERTKNGAKILLEEMKASGIYMEEIKSLDIDLVLQSCQLHDIGKIAISDSILKKTGKLDKDEFDEMKKHTEYGKKIIGKIQLSTKDNYFLKYAKIFATSHHEKWDGTGYPYGLAKNEIPLLGRVMTIADVYDALTSIRPYKNAFSHDEAVQIITENSGKQFDPTLVIVFIKTAERFRELSDSYK